MTRRPRAGAGAGGRGGAKAKGKTKAKAKAKSKSKAKAKAKAKGSFPNLSSLKAIENKDEAEDENSPNYYGPDGEEEQEQEGSDATGQNEDTALAMVDAQDQFKDYRALG